MDEEKDEEEEEEEKGVSLALASRLAAQQSSCRHGGCGPVLPLVPRAPLLLLPPSCRLTIVGSRLRRLLPIAAVAPPPAPPPADPPTALSAAAAAAAAAMQSDPWP